MQNPNLQGSQLDMALATQTWDASVKALVEVPTALNQMSQRLDWTQKLGDAFLAQQKDVMDSVQRLRQRAQSAGKLMSTEQQKIVTENQTIVIEQANPQTMYVPYYDPYLHVWRLAVCGLSALLLGRHRPGYYLGAGLAFGLGVAIGGARGTTGSIGTAATSTSMSIATTSPTSTETTSATGATTPTRRDGSTTPSTGAARTIAIRRHVNGSARAMGLKRTHGATSAGSIKAQGRGQFGDRDAQQLGQRSAGSSGPVRRVASTVSATATQRAISAIGARASRQSMNASRGYSGGGRVAVLAAAAVASAAAVAEVAVAAADVADGSNSQRWRMTVTRRTHSHRTLCATLLGAHPGSHPRRRGVRA